METYALRLDDAESFLKNHERHYKSDAKAFCAIGLIDEDKKLRGAAILGTDAYDDATLVHIYVDGAWQGYSLLYGACWRAFKALGYKKVNL